MATVYSLICWGGSLGKAVTVATATDLVTLTNHGLRNATGVQFTSGTLPTVAGTALALNTTYYAKSIAVSTFELYYDSGLTSKIDFTGTGSSLILKGAYYQGLADKSRWTDGGVERIYDSLGAWYTARSAACTEYDPEVCEIGEAWTDIASGFSVNMAAPEVLITTRVNGVRSSGFHFGVPYAGYTFKGASTSGIYLFLTSEIDGFTITATATTNVYLCMLYGLQSVARNMMAYNVTTTGGVGFGIVSSGAKIINCMAWSVGAGFSLGANYRQCVIANCIATGCATGMSSAVTTSRYGYIYNNISIGNTANWSPAPTTLERASNNFGEAGDVPWTAGAGTTGIVAATDFVDYANKDFRPALATSPQVEGGAAYYGVTTSDISDAVVPNYMNGAAAVIDAGCYEFDHGYGPWPASATLTLVGANASLAGAEVRIYDMDNIPAGSLGTELAGVESCAGSTFSYTYSYGTTPNHVWIQVMAPGFVEYGQEYTLATSDTTLSLILQAELNT